MMDTSENPGGSSISVRARAPSLRLAELAEQLAESVAASSAVLGAGQLPFISAESGRLVVNTDLVLRRLVTQAEFTQTFTPSDTAGFISDMVMPPPGTSAKVGGRLVPGSEAAVTRAIKKLHEAVSGWLDTALNGVSPETLLGSSLQQVLDRMATSAGIQPPRLPHTASMVPIQFAENGRPAEERNRDLARVLTTIETLDGSDWLEVLLNSIANELQRREIDEDEIGAILASIREQRLRPGSQIRRFIDFLEDEALARVRLQVTMRLMSVIAETGSPALQTYVQRVRACYEHFAGPQGEGLTLEVATAFGIGSNIDLAEELRTARFYSCLPVWPEYSVQLFEAHTEPSQGFGTQREVSYRFRINGKNPFSRTTAFQARLGSLREELLNDDDDERRRGRSVAQVVFLHLVIPESQNPAPAEVFAEATRIADKLKHDPKGTLRLLLDSLEKRVPVMNELARELVGILRNRSKQVISTLNRTADRFWVVLLRGIINWDAVLATESSDTEILIKNNRGPDTVAWFSQLVISETAPTGGSSVASYSVSIDLNERSLVVSGNNRAISMQRDLSAPTLSIRFVPHNTQFRLFDTGCGVEIRYDPQLLAQRKTGAEQLRAASCTAFALLTYTVLWEVARRLRATQNGSRVAATIVRLQSSGKEVAHTHGDAALYAISHSIERALAADLPVKLQGLDVVNQKDMEWRKKGALAALIGGQPLHFPMEGSLERVALVSYVTRPCDRHPQLDTDEFLFISRTYQAVRNGSLARLELKRMRSRLVEDPATLDTPRRIPEELRLLHRDGFQHVILLSHHFGNRRIGRAADRHAPHSSLAFLKNVTVEFPEMRLYTLRRDIFPALRLRSREKGEAGFEVTEYGHHQAMYKTMASELKRGLMPVYTFATLVVVAEEGRPQSGFCTYFYDIEGRFEQGDVSLEIAEQTRQNILGTGDTAKGVRDSLISVLRAVHFMESEKPSSAGQLLPVLDPFDWASPSTAAAAGELTVMAGRRKGEVLLCFPAILAHITAILREVFRKPES